MGMLMCDRDKAALGAGMLRDRLQPPHPRRKANRAIKVTQESEEIILKRASAAQDSLVQCC